MKQVARNLTDPIHGFLRGAKHLIHDRRIGILTHGFPFRGSGQHGRIRLQLKTPT
jgi:hypothetical protein